MNLSRGSSFKLFAGLALIAFGIIVGIVGGLGFFFVGGIVQLVQGIIATPVDVLDIAFGALRLLITGPSIWLAAGILAIPGWCLVKSSGF